ncbi:MAG: amino acid permease, partial [Acetobacter sp.]|nr:amino acid permease [Acetobacter sp.]
IKIGIIFGFTSVLITLLFGQSRIFLTMAHDGLLPHFFSVTHSHFQTPWISNLFIMAMTALLAAFFPISDLGHMTSIGTLFAFILVCLIVMILRRKEPDYPRTFRVPGGDVIPILGILSSATIMVCLDLMTWMRLIAWLVIGMAIYFLYGIRHSKLAHVHHESS